MAAECRLVMGVFGFHCSFGRLRSRSSTSRPSSIGSGDRKNHSDVQTFTTSAESESWRSGGTYSTVQFESQYVNCLKLCVIRCLPSTLYLARLTLAERRLTAVACAACHTRRLLYSTTVGVAA
ncbi:hypothetical protein PHLGIDRAFT_459859 [Phlebiopsis gigantea 11061_1 CR5-6]|uniref:Uncharacterized protein n=1 Tax=Phlebiopsis gigantea (strain 11061_1 CR5-6) TaxID=745531 RepID=A0A0C3RXD0_PHLG1|nr:hypothetical protein PHLGIDRAFT_459859 [Phlebiopsis gigantea 11061_1 CR5-6]